MMITTKTTSICLFELLLIKYVSLPCTCKTEKKKKIIFRILKIQKEKNLLHRIKFVHRHLNQWHRILLVNFVHHYYLHLISDNLS